MTSENDRYGRIPPAMCRAAMWPRYRHAVACMVAWGVLASLAACSSDDRNRDLSKSLGEMRVAVEVARSAETRIYAGSELSVAAEKLAECRNALDRDDVALAERLLAEAEVNLVLARAKVDAARAKAKLEEATMAAPVPPASPPGGSPAPAR
jgi:hypothetical protein